MAERIYYKSGYKYQTNVDYEVDVKITAPGDVRTPYIDLTRSGHLIIKKGYAWDGPSGPSIDTKNFMRGSLIHDALYQLLRQGKLVRDWREQADRELQRACREDGMSRLRAWWVYQAVRRHGAPSASPRNLKPVQMAP